MNIFFLSRCCARIFFFSFFFFPYDPRDNREIIGARLRKTANGRFKLTFLKLGKEKVKTVPNNFVDELDMKPLIYVLSVMVSNYIEKLGLGTTSNFS